METAAARLRLLRLALAVALTFGAGPPALVRVDNWDHQGEGLLTASQEWKFYPRSATTKFKDPPAIVLDSGRRVLHLATDRESLGIWRAVALDVSQAPHLVWEWKALTLPQGGDVRQPTRNDQAGRVMLMFEGWKCILYVWDSSAPVGAEVHPDNFGELVDRVLVVVRSGPSGLGQWHQEERNVYQDFVRFFEQKPGRLKSLGLESHSDDVRSQSAIRFGSIRFDVSGAVGARRR